MRDTHRHRAFGLTLAAPLRLPAPAAAADAPIDVAITVEPVLPPPGEGEATRVSQLMQIVFATDSAILHAHGLDFAQRYTMRITRSGIAVGWSAGVEPADVARHLVGPGLVAQALLAGRTCLHGCAVQTPAGAIVILGASGRGKSTLAAALVAAGLPLIAEEYVVIAEDELACVPAIPALKVSRETAPLLGLAGRSEPTFRHPDFAGEGMTVTLDRDSFAGDAPVPLAAVYVLDPRHRDTGVHLSLPLPPAQAAGAVAEHTYWGAALPPELRTRFLRRALDIVQHCPVRRLAVPDDLEALPRVAAAIRAPYGISR